ncbi:MAG: hypothetical protein K6G30_10775 [Acetatifactor sp.]|nr:hypothetical protein [Acetatifactor sp.]
METLRCQNERILYYFLIGCLYLFFAKGIIEPHIKWFGLMDEVFVLLAPAVLLFKRKIKRTILIPLVLGYVLSGIFGTILFGYQPWNAVLADFIACVKIWLAIYIGYEMYSYFDLEFYAPYIYRHLKIIIGTIGIAFILDAFFDLWPVGERYGIKVFFLFGTNGSVMNSEYVMLLMMLFLIIPYVKKTAIWFMTLYIALFMSLRTKAMGIVLVALFLSYTIHYRGRKISVKRLVLPVFAIICCAIPSIIFYYFGPNVSQSPRAQLTNVSFLIARDLFPIGTGLATFGSFYSGKYYSPIYALYGIDNVYGMTKENTMYLSDTCWPILFGQFGWLGTIFFVAALLVLWGKIQKQFLINKGKYMAAMLFFLATLVNSTSEPAFFNSVIVANAFLCGIAISTDRTTPQLL